MLGVDEAAGHQVWDKTFGMTARHVSDVLTVRVHPSAAVVAVWDIVVPSGLVIVKVTVTPATAVPSAVTLAVTFTF